jgi:DNA-binding NarL/FixJ family response regulator
VADPTIVRRERELSLLGRRIAAAGQGTGGLVVLHGPVGIGKTTLARWCLDAARAAGGTALMAAALGPELESPLGVWARLAASADPLGTAAVLVRGDVEQLHPHARYAATLAFVRSLTPAPAVVVVDDLHNADEASTAVLAQLAPALASSGVLVVATWRGTPWRAGHDRDLIDVLGPWAETIALGQFDVALVRELAQAAAGGDSGEWAAAVAPALAARTGGNPLLLRAILDDLGVADGARPSPDEVAASGADGAVADVLGRRLLSLPASCREMLELLALVGGQATPVTLAEFAERDLTDDLASAIGAGVVSTREGGAIGFVHPAWSDAVHARLVDGRPEVRRRIATVLTRRGRPDDLPAIAQHLAAAGTMVPPAELHAAAMTAAAQALRTGDHAVAARSLDLALDTGVAADAVPLLLDSAAAHHVAGHRDTAWQRARTAADMAGEARPVELARAALSYAQGRGYATDRTGAADLLREALRALDDAHPLRRDLLAQSALLEISLPVAVELQELDHLPGRSEADGDATQRTVAWNWVHRVEIARAMAEEALVFAPAPDDAVGAAVAAAWRQTRCAPEYLRERVALVDRARAHATAAQDRVPLAIAAVLDHLEAGHRALVDDALGELVVLSDETGDPAVRWRTGQLAAMTAFASGHPDLAARHATEAFAHGAQAGERGRWVVRGVQTTMLSVEADDDPSDTVAFLAANLDALSYPPMRAGALYALSATGHLDPVRAALPALVANLVDDTFREASWLVTAALTADAIAAVNDPRLAPQLLDVLLPFSEHIAVDGLGFHCHGCVARPMARLAALSGDVETAASLRAIARDRDAAAGLRTWVLHGAVDGLAADDIDPRARRDAAQALAADASALGLRRVARRAQAVGAPVEAARLTARQHEVLAALAEGLTYQSVGERLGFSHSTIRHEAMRVYAALGAGDRNEAVRAARELGLLPEE